MDPHNAQGLRLNPRFRFYSEMQQKIKEYILYEIFLFRHSPDIVHHIFDPRLRKEIHLALSIIEETRTDTNSSCGAPGIHLIVNISTFTKMRRLPNLVEFYLFLVFWVLCKILQNCCVNVKRSFDWATFSLPFYWKLPIPLSSYRKLSAAFAITSFQVKC